MVDIYDFGPPTDAAGNVPASVNKYGADYGQEILDNTGEQNQSFAGDAAFNDATRPDQFTNNPDAVSDYGSLTGAGAAGTSTTVTKSATSVSPASDPSQFPAYDDNGNLQPGFKINEETGLLYYAGAVTPTTSAIPVDTNQSGEGFGNVYPDGFGGYVNGDGQAVDVNGLLIPTGNNITRSAAAVNTQDGQAFGPVLPDPNGNGGFVDAAGNPVNADGSPIFPAAPINTANEEAAIQTEVGRQLAQNQKVYAEQKKAVNNGDWRVRLSLAKGANYLYNDPGNGILYPLALTSGVIFPYLPQIETSYKADYDAYALTHSNYKGYFYKSSYTDAVNMTAVFTAQDTAEANYLLAVIHFFRSVTKMFYGQDAQRGAPPPLVYLTGLGEYQFAAHPCVVTSFNYSLPADVDYIRTRSTNINGANMLTRRDRQTTATDPISGAVGRLQNLFNSQGISKGAETCRPPPPTLGQNQPTYVPTRMQMMISLLPIQRSTNWRPTAASRTFCPAGAA
jgi:hypothetical protein